MSRTGLKGLAVLVSLIAAGVLALPAVAAANQVVNGDFETGTLEGWTVVDLPSGPGTWFLYSGTENPVPDGPPLPPPPEGEFAAITSQEGPGTHILYQDIPIEAGQPYLSMTVYYQSEASFAVFEPETLESEPGGPNQQYRIEVIDPAAPLETLEPEDVLATVFRTLPGDPTSRAPKTVGVDLSEFAGQTVRLRLSEVDNQGPLFAGVDSVETGPVPPPPPPPPTTPASKPAASNPQPPPSPPSNAFSFGKLTLNKKKGTAKLQVSLPGAGSLAAVDAKKKGKRIKKATATATGAGVATLVLKPTASGMKTLKVKGKLAFKALVTFTPTGGTAATQTRSGKLKLTLPK